ncbi:MAG TPA: transglycosylase SLT domain-containing protein, partial [Steroidobacteraceae bacterium]|nr:transglycosylase SLT domain-containing protein [Steroidobacteraceae bacterium]
MLRPRSPVPLLRLLLCSLLLAAGAARADEAIPFPRALRPDVHFWVRVYTEITTDEGFIHDDEDLRIVYETLHFDPDLSDRARERQVDEARKHYAALLRHMATSSDALSPEEQRIRNLWGDDGTPIRLLEASNHVRFQLGQADRFREGLVRSGRWQGHIERVLSSLGLPPELGVLPHVESSFNAAAYSKAGAAGLWQFMRSTGRRYMRIDSTVDDRMDPFRSTEAAAQLLSYNYRLLGTWPLAITAYNHGAEGMLRARQELGTDDIVTILRDYHSPSFGFASRNYYVSFLAALEIDRHPGKYFGSLIREPQSVFQEVAMPAFVNVAALARALHIDLATLRNLNPALLPACWEGRRRVPKGYLLRLPAQGTQWTPGLLEVRLGPAQLRAHQSEPERRRVQRHETLASIAADYGLTAAELARMNGISPRRRLRPGRWLRVPEAEPVRVAFTAPPPAPAAAPGSTSAAPAEPAVPGSTSAAPAALPPASVPGLAAGAVAVASETAAPAGAVPQVAASAAGASPSVTSAAPRSPAESA